MEATLSKEKKSVYVLLIYLLTTLLLFGSVINNTFSADDYKIVYRLSKEGLSLGGSFFRPLADLSLLADYGLYGYNANGFHVSSLLLHCLNSWFVYLLALRLVSVLKIDRPGNLPFWGGFFFLIFPFHIEPVVWISARNSSLATFLSLLSFLISISQGRFYRKLMISSLLYFGGLFAYELVFPLPALIVFCCWLETKNIRLVFLWIVSLTASIALHFLIRSFATNSILGGEYASFVFDQQLLERLGKIFRVLARLIAPPNVSAKAFLFFFGFISLFYGGLFVYAYRFRKSYYRSAIIVLSMVLVSCLVAFTFPVSTKTSESDRLLYFPSVFFVLLILILVHSLPRRAKAITVTILVLFQLYYSAIQIGYWNRASDQMKQLLERINDAQQANKNILLVNLPEEINGAYMLPGVLSEALVMRGIKTENVQMINFLDGTTLRSIKEPYEIKKKDTLTWNLPPVTLVTYSKERNQYIIKSSDVSVIHQSSNTEIWYWNGFEYRFLISSDFF